MLFMKQIRQTHQLRLVVYLKATGFMTVFGLGISEPSTTGKVGGLFRRWDIDEQ